MACGTFTVLLLYAVIITCHSEHLDHYLHREGESDDVNIRFPAYDVVTVAPELEEPCNETVLCPNNTRCLRDGVNGRCRCVKPSTSTTDCTAKSSDLTVSHHLPANDYSHAKFSYKTSQVIELFAIGVVICSLFFLLASFVHVKRRREQSLPPYIIRFHRDTPGSQWSNHRLGSGDVEILNAHSMPYQHRRGYAANRGPSSDSSTNQRSLHQNTRIYHISRSYNPVSQSSTNISTTSNLTTNQTPLSLNLANHNSLLAYQPLSIANQNSEATVKASPSATAGHSKLSLKKLCNSQLLKVDKKTLKYLIDRQLPLLKSDTVYGQYGLNCIRNLLEKQSPTTDVYNMPDKAES